VKATTVNAPTLTVLTLSSNVFSDHSPKSSALLFEFTVQQLSHTIPWNVELPMAPPGVHTRTRCAHDRGDSKADGRVMQNVPDLDGDITVFEEYLDVAIYGSWTLDAT
jgi:hypothetical protein